MVRRIFSIALLLALSQSAIAGSEDVKTRPNKEEIADLVLKAGRMSGQEQSARIDQILKDQAGSQSPRSDFLFCTGLAYLGNYKAQMCVGTAYEKRLRVVEDLSEAYAWYELALGNDIPVEADASKAAADRDRTKERLLSAYPHPTEDELSDMVNAQKTRISQYREQTKKSRN